MAWFVDQMGEVVEAVQWEGGNAEEIVDLMATGPKPASAITLMWLTEIVKHEVMTHDPGCWVVLLQPKEGDCAGVAGVVSNKRFWSHYRPHRPPTKEK